MYLNDSYKKCNPGFGYTSNLNPRRSLTKPSEPAGNDGHDNENSDLIISVNDILVSDDGTSGEYEVRDVLGSGTFGQVVRCRQKGTGKAAAIKVIKNHPAYFHQAHVEIGILHMLNTECDQRDERHIVRMMDHFVHRSHLCICFEVLNINLYELLRQNNFRGLSMSLVRVFLRQLLGSLSVLRGANVIHCDLKPENILIKSLDTGEINLIDFGSACFQNRTVYQYIQSRFYRSPEVVLGAPYGMPIDMWSLGCVAAELFLGLPLFPGASEYNLLSRICETLGTPPAAMIAKASNSHKFFQRTDENAGIDGASNASYRLMTLDEYERKTGKKTPVGKKYFKHTKLADIIQSVGFASGLTDEQIAKERTQRAALLDFLNGLLQADPNERWTPDQALQHPLITEAPFTGSWTPPPITEDATKKATAEEQSQREQSAARAAADVSRKAKDAKAAAAAKAAEPPTPPQLQPEPATPDLVQAGFTQPQSGAATSGGLAAALASAPEGGDPAAQMQLQQQQLQQQQQQWSAVAAANVNMAAQMAAAAAVGIPVQGMPANVPMGTPADRSQAFVSSWSAGGTFPYGMSPHAMNSAALHPLHFGQSPPTSQMSHMGFAAGMQNAAAAAAAAAAVQLPALQGGGMVMGTPQGFGVQMQQRAGQGGQQPGAGGIPQGFQGFHPGANFTGPQSMPHNARVAGGMGPPPPKPAQQQVGFNIPGAQQSTPPGRGKPPAASPSSFTPGSLSQTRGFRIHTVEEDGAESDDMDMDGVGGSDPNSRRSSGMGARKRSNEAFNDPSEWDPNFSDELLLDGEGGAQHAAPQQTAAAPGSSAMSIPGSGGAGDGGANGGFGGFQSQSVPKWSSHTMTGHAGFSPQQQVGGWPGHMNVDQQNAAIAANLNAYLQQQQQNVAAAAAMNTFHQGSPQQQMGFFPPGGVNPQFAMQQQAFAQQQQQQQGFNLTGLAQQPHPFNGQAQQNQKKDSS